MGVIDDVADLVRRRDFHLAEAKKIEVELRRFLVPESKGAPAAATVEVVSNNGQVSMAEAAIAAIRRAGRPVTFRELQATLRANNPASLRSTLYRLAGEKRIRADGKATYSAMED